MKRWMDVTNCLGIGTLLLASNVAAADESIFFIQLSDLQFGMFANNKDFAQETANLEFAVATANRIRPAFVVITGDLATSAGWPIASG